MTCKTPKVKMPETLLKSSPKLREYEVLEELKSKQCNHETLVLIETKYQQFLYYLKAHGFDVVLESLHTNEYASKIQEDINDIIRHYKLYYSSCAATIESKKCNNSKKRAKYLYNFWNNL